MANIKPDKAKSSKTAKKVKTGNPGKTKLVMGLPDPKPEGRPTAYKPEFAAIAKAMAKHGATDFDIAEELGVTTVTIWNWRSRHPDFFNALLEGKDAFDDRVERSLAQKAVGYTYHSEKVMQFEGQIVRADVTEHVPPDVGAIKLWLSNRRPEKWRDKSEVNLTGDEAFVKLWQAVSSGTPVSS